MKSSKLMYIIGIAIVLLVSVIIGLIFVDTRVSSPRPSSQKTEPNNTSMSQPANETLQQCLDRVSNSEAQQSIIEESKRECERLYRP